VAEGDVTGLTDDEIDALTDEERDTLNDADADTDSDAEPDDDGEEVDLRPAFVGWVLEHFAIVEVVGTKDRAPWCDRWYDHPEVVARLFAVWQAHLQARQEESMEASSNWWLSHWDRHAAVLFDRQNGPFRACTSREGHLAERRTGTTQVIVPTVPGPDWVL
jgi:hypothetical protein